LRFRAWQHGWIRWRGEEGDGPDRWGQLVGKRGETRRQEKGTNLKRKMYS
jgi:hypothetical protein